MSTDWSRKWLRRADGGDRDWPVRQLIYGGQVYSGHKPCHFLITIHRLSKRISDANKASFCNVQAYAESLVLSN